MPPDDFDSTSLRSPPAFRRSGPAPPPRCCTKPAPTIAAAPTGARAQRVRELLERTAACTEPVEQQRLRRLVVTEYLPVARSLASRYSGRGVERNDLEQLAFLGLVKAVRRWEPGRSEDFLQFAVPTIVGEIKRYFRDHSWLVRPPRRIQELRAAINEAEQTYRHNDGTGPTESELADATGVSTRDIGEARSAASFCRPRSLDEGQGLGLALALGWGDEDPGAAPGRGPDHRAATAGHPDRPGAGGRADALQRRLVAGPDRHRDRRQPDAGVPLAAHHRRQAAVLDRDVTIASVAVVSRRSDGVGSAPARDRRSISGPSVGVGRQPAGLDQRAGHLVQLHVVLLGVAPQHRRTTSPG